MSANGTRSLDRLWAEYQHIQSCWNEPGTCGKWAPP
jgi:hypothetical protein